MTAAELRRRDPVTYDRLGQRGGWAARRSAPTATAYAQAFGHTRQHGARAFAGHAASAAAKNLQTIYLLCTGDETTALAQLCEEWALMTAQQIRPLTDTQLQQLIEDLDRRIAHSDARKNVRAAETRSAMTSPDDDEGAAECDMEAGQLCVYRAEAKRERADRRRRGTWRP